MKPTLDQLDSRTAMLETLKLAYQHILDHCTQIDGEPLGVDEKRLSPAQEYELGRRLVAYWLIPSPKTNSPLR